MIKGRLMIYGCDLQYGLFYIKGYTWGLRG